MPIYIEGTGAAIHTQAGKCVIAMSQAAANGLDCAPILMDSGAVRFIGTMLFLFPDDSVAIWDVTVSTWTVFTDLAQGIESVESGHGNLTMEIIRADPDIRA